MTSHLTRKNDQTDTVPQNTPRLRLKQKGPRTGFVDGAWWPHTTELDTELPDLLAVLSVRLGSIERVLYHLDSWTDAPRKVGNGARSLRLDGYRRQAVNTVEVLGFYGERLTLLVVPPRTDPEQAHTIMMTAAEPDNIDTADELLDTRSDEVTGHPLTESADGHLKSDYAVVKSRLATQMEPA